MAGGNQNSLFNVIGLLGDLGNNLDILTQETSEVVDNLESPEEQEPLNELIGNLEDLQDTLTLLEPEAEDLEDTFSPLRSGDVQLVGSSEERILSEPGTARGSPDVLAGTRELLRTVAGLDTEQHFQLTYIDVIILVFIMLGFLFILLVSCIMFSYCWRRLSRRQKWRDLSQSETDSSVSWISIDTTNTEDSPVKDCKPVSKCPAVQTGKLSPICSKRVPAVSRQFVLDKEVGQWCRTEISPSIIV